jgi:hypothetical protein
MAVYLARRITRTYQTRCALTRKCTNGSSPASRSPTRAAPAGQQAPQPPLLLRPPLQPAQLPPRPPMLRSPLREPLPLPPVPWPRSVRRWRPCGGGFPFRKCRSCRSWTGHSRTRWARWLGDRGPRSPKRPRAPRRTGAPLTNAPHARFRCVYIVRAAYTHARAHILIWYPHSTFLFCGYETNSHTRMSIRIYVH